jgi:ferric-dicitrate binding protein FerR (iron transport regulator)
MSGLELTDELLLRYLDQATSPDEELFVAARLARDAAARRRYARLSHLHALVAEAARGQVDQAPARRPRWRWWLGGAAACAAGLVLALYGLGELRTAPEPAPAPPAVLAARPSISISDCRGQVAIRHGGQLASAVTGAALAAADELTVPADGSLEIDWHDGAVVRLDGGAHARIGGGGDAPALALEDGTLHARIAHRPQALVIAAGTVRISDLGTEFSVVAAGEAVLVSVASGRVAVAQGAGTVAVDAGRSGGATQTGGPWLAARHPTVPLGAAAWREPALGCAPDPRPLVLDAQSWHAEPLASCSVPAQAGAGSVVGDGAGAVLGQVPLPDLARSGQALAGLELLEVAARGHAWLLRFPTLGADGRLHARALSDGPLRGAPPALGGLFAPADLAPGAAAHGLAVALPPALMQAAGLAIGDRLLGPAPATSLPSPSPSPLRLALQSCARQGLVIVASAQRPTLFYDRRLGAELRPQLGEELRALAALGFTRLVVTTAALPAEQQAAPAPAPH